MKKLLALVLALVMTLSLATVGTNAAFEDASDISYEEAANVLSAVGVFVGDGKNFAPKAALNREQAAKLVAYLALGEDVAEALPAVAMFDDVAASSWAAKYIAYCADAGIITGDGAGKFYPTNPVDGYAFAKMVMCALGYNAEAEGFVGGNWSINVAKQAKALDLAKGGVDLAKNLTREEAAQVMFNAIKCQPVKYNVTGSSVTIGDVVVEKDYGPAVADGAGKYYEQTWDAANGALTQSPDHDDFGRDAVKWVFEGKEVSRVADDTPDFVITEAMTAKEVAKLLKGYKLNTYKVENDTVNASAAAYTYSSNGNTGASLTLNAGTIAAAIQGLTQDGKVVEIYADSSLNIDQIVTISYSTTQVDKVTTDKKTGVVSYNFENISATYKDDEDTVLVYEGELAKGDILTYVVANGMMYLYPTTTITGDLTTYDQDGVYTISGDAKTKSVAFTTSVDSGVAMGLMNNAKFWLDQYGYVVMAKGVSTASANYAYILGVDADCTESFGTFTPAAKAKVLLADGTVAIYDLKLAKKTAASVSNWYVVDADSNPVGSALTAVATTADGELEAISGIYTYVLEGNTIAIQALPGSAAGKASAYSLYGYTGASYVVKGDAKLATTYSNAADAYMNDATSYIFWDGDEVDGVVVGNTKLGDYKFQNNANTVVVAGWNEAGTVLTVKYVFVMGGYASEASAVDVYGFIDKDEFTTSKDGDKTIKTYTMTLADGTTVSLKSEETISASGLYKYNTDKSVKNANVLNSNERVASGHAQVEGSVIDIAGEGVYNMSADAKIVDVSDIYDEADDANVIVYLDKDKKVVEALFIVDAAV